MDNIHDGDDISAGRDENEHPANQSTLEDLIARAKILLDELDTFRNRLLNLRHGGNVDISGFRNTVKSELKMLEKMALKPETLSTANVIRSANTVYYEYLWCVAKRSKNVVALQRRLYLDPGEDGVADLQHRMYVHHMDSSRTQKRYKKRQDKPRIEDIVTVDAITDDGSTFCKVSLTTSKSFWLGRCYSKAPTANSL